MTHRQITTRQPPSQHFITMKHLKISCKKYKIVCLLLSSRCTQNYTKTCSFQHAHYTESWEVCEKTLVKTFIYWLDICCWCTLELPLWGNSNVYQCVPTAYVTEIKKTYFEKYFFHESCLFALPLLNISNCQSVLKYLSLYGILLYLHGSYITNLISWTYAFAKLLLARL